MNGTMKAVVFQELGKAAVEERPIPCIEDPKDAIVRVTLAAICSSDIHIKHGMIARAKEGVILGHEIVGEIVETGAGVRKLKAGDRVTVNNETFCGECFFCRRGYVNNCEQGGWMLGCVQDGGQAEYVRVPYADNCCNIIPEGAGNACWRCPGNRILGSRDRGDQARRHGRRDRCGAYRTLHFYVRKIVQPGPSHFYRSI